MQGAIEDLITDAIAVIKSGGTVIYPTETVYGLGADALSEVAVRKVYTLKQRDLSRPISLAVSSFEMLERVAYLDPSLMELLTELLPGPVTVLLRRRDTVPEILTAALDVVGVRFPDNELATRIIEKTGPITATSANISGRNPPTSVEEVELKADIILNGGKCKYGMPSTVVDMTRRTANGAKTKIQIEIKRRGAGYDRVLYILRRKAVREGLHGFSVPSLW
ncbi:MAG: threonylcarbamoyl-AMP synthase [Methanophagales archaeon ANME-1-THS]|nr:MAG: threonylcarbamoyl-AMP synthase [Methanophagales archaeon ANME-1-THS]